MSDLPSGTVTFLFTDVEGSTLLLRELGGGYAQALAGYRRTLRTVLARHGGVEVDTQGDAFFVAFARASEAVAAATAMQEALKDGPMRVRMGLHTGEPLVSEEGYVGLDVHRAARIASAAHGGQVLLSQSTRELLDAEVVLRDRGEHRLKDLGERLRLYQLGGADFPPLKSLNQTNLPLQLTPLIGRTRELGEVLGRLRSHGLVTLTGPGGSGKTRLAVQSAAELADEFADGVWFVPLGALREPELVVPTIAQTLGKEPQILEEHLAQKQMLLLLDSFEHLLEAAPMLAVLRQAPKVKLLVTSRASLGLTGEREYSVPPLSEEEATHLFVARAQAATPGFHADAAVPLICRRLDNLPLAIELAAARLKVLSTEALLERLEHRLQVLTGGPRDLPEMQRTLRNTIAWSYELLRPEERELFARLAVFAGGCTIDAAEEVADADLDTLQALVDNSLVGKTHDRISMLETIREFALERLEESGKAEQLSRSHSTWFLDFAESMANRPRGRELGSRVDRLAAEHDNFRAAREWMLSAHEFDLEVRMAAALQEFFEARGHAVEGRRWLEAGLSRPIELPNDVRAKAVYGLGRFVESSGDYGRAATLYAEALELFRSTNDRAGVVEALIELGTAERRAGHLDRAEAFTNESIALARTLGDPEMVSGALHGAGYMAIARGDHVRARNLFQESLQLRRESGNAIGTSVSLVTLGWLALRANDLAGAAASFEEALVLGRDVNDTESIAYALDNLGLVALRLSEYERAEELFAESVTLAAAMDNRELVAECLAGIAAARAAENPARLARLLGASTGLHETIDTAISEDEDWIMSQFVDAARTKLGKDLFSAEWARGKAMSLEEAVEYAVARHDESEPRISASLR